MLSIQYVKVLIIRLHLHYYVVKCLLNSFAFEKCVYLKGSIWPVSLKGIFVAPRRLPLQQDSELATQFDLNARQHEPLKQSWEFLGHLIANVYVFRPLPLRNFV